MCYDFVQTASVMTDAIRSLIKERTVLKAEVINATNAGVNLVMDGWAALPQLINLMFLWRCEAFGSYASTPKAARAAYLGEKKGAFGRMTRAMEKVTENISQKLHEVPDIPREITAKLSGQKRQLNRVAHHYIDKLRADKLSAKEAWASLTEFVGINKNRMLNREDRLGWESVQLQHAVESAMRDSTTRGQMMTDFDKVIADGELEVRKGKTKFTQRTESMTKSTKRLKSCYHCGKLGHLKRDCRARQ